ncbi:MAG TPA: hypothetical protein DEO95_10685 [Ruminococcaceae bacterium]|nr:hypothetical protein [Oscillospiraceae bacterium]
MSDSKIMSYENAMHTALKYANQRELILWGNDAPFREYLKKTHNITIEKTVTAFEKKVTDNRIFFRSLKGQSDKYYIILPNIQPSAIFKKRLLLLGFKEGKDYIFIRRSKTVLPAGYGTYRDPYGNVVQTGGCRVFLSPYAENCEIFVDKGFKGDFLIRVFGKGGVKVRIGKNCKSSGSSRLFIHDGGEFTMGDGVSIGDNTKFSVSANNRITIGDDCMFSYDILVFSGDGHAIFDMTTGQRMNSYAITDPKGSITMGKHVWICAGVYILNRANIGNSCILGANATVKGDIPDYSIAAGNPARIVKSNVTWSRNPDAEEIGECFTNWNGFPLEDNEKS